MAFTRLVHRIRPKDHLNVLRPLLPARYAPLQPNGNGIQSVYLTELTPDFAEALGGIIGAEVQPLMGGLSVGAPMQTTDDLDWWEHKIEHRIERDPAIPVTDREAIIRARRGQGLFKQRVMQIERRCRRRGRHAIATRGGLSHAQGVALGRHRGQTRHRRHPPSSSEDVPLNEAAKLAERLLR